MGTHDEALDAFRSGDNERARALSEEAMAAARGARDLAGQVDALCMLARCALRAGDVVRVRGLADQARACARAAGEKRLEPVPLHMQAVAARMSGSISEEVAPFVVELR
jgi:hypothetical protein